MKPKLVHPGGNRHRVVGHIYPTEVIESIRRGMYAQQHQEALWPHPSTVGLHLFVIKFLTEVIANGLQWWLRADLPDVHKIGTLKRVCPGFPPAILTPASVHRPSDDGPISFLRTVRAAFRTLFGMLAVQHRGGWPTHLSA